MDKLNLFHDAIQSLKLYRRAEIPNQTGSEEIIKRLYVDPLPNEHIFQTVLRPNTTFIIGRKGTGKSTIFQRLQKELVSDNQKTSAYIDIKTVFESSQINHDLYDRLALSSSNLPRDEFERILLLKAFITSVIHEIKSELEKRIQSTFISRIKERISGNVSELFEDLDELLDEIDDDKFISALGVKAVSSKTASENIHALEEEVNAQTSLSSSPSLSVGGKVNESNSARALEEHNYTDILVKIFDTKELLTKLQAILANIGVRHLYILVDDFSELPQDAMGVVVDLLLAPLNNWSNEFIKFKVAAYPGRIYYGNIDKTKIDEIFLDIFKLYGTTDVAAMEERATEFVKRLILTRLDVYDAGDITDFFDGDMDETWRVLFYASMANPRIIGYLLHFCHESHLLYGNKIGVRAIQQAARRYYEEKVESYFALSKFLHESFDEKSSIYGLKELLELIVSRAKELRSHSSTIFDAIEGRPPTSHFHISVPFEAILRTLELNFFLTKYYEMSDRDGRKVSVYALNYGLCQKYTLNFGRPTGKREFRTYLIERVFDYTPLLQQYMANNQEIVCTNCGSKYSINDLDALRFYGMKCRECNNGKCEVINLSRKYESDLRKIDKELLLPETELGILQTLHLMKGPMFAADIASELDCSYQLIGKRGKFMSDKGLVERNNNETGRRTFVITDLAEESYFIPSTDDALNVSDENE